MSEFQKIFFAQRLKEVAKKQFGTIGNLADLIKNSNLSNYTKSKPTEPQAGLLFKLAEQNININFLLTGEEPILMSDLVNRGEHENLVKRLERLEKLFADQALLLTQKNDEIGELKKELSDKDQQIQILLKTTIEKDQELSAERVQSTKINKAHEKANLGKKFKK